MVVRIHLRSIISSCSLSHIEAGIADRISRNPGGEEEEEGEGGRGGYVPQDSNLHFTQSLGTTSAVTRSWFGGIQFRWPLSLYPSWYLKAVVR